MFCRLVPAALILTAVVSQGASAMPIAPRALWQLARDAKLIVVAKVRSVRRHSNQLRLATLVVRDVWKGTLGRSRIVEVATLESMCPAPARYPQGRVVLAFLEPWRDGRYRTTGMSYGSLYPPSPDLPVFRERVREALALQARPTSVGPGEWVEWHVATAVRAATRWHGLYPLLPRRHYRPRAGLFLIQRRRIADGFVTDPRVDLTFAMVLRLLEGFEHKDFDRVAAAALDSLLTRDKAPWWHPMHYAVPIVPRLWKVVVRVAKRIGVEFPEAYRKPSKLRSWWALVRRRLWPSLKPLRVSHRRSRVPGVGEETPP